MSKHASPDSILAAHQTAQKLRTEHLDADARGRHEQVIRDLLPYLFELTAEEALGLGAWIFDKALDVYAMKLMGLDKLTPDELVRAGVLKNDWPRGGE